LSVTNIMPLLTEPEPMPPTTTSVRATSGALFTMASAFCTILSVSPMSELTAVVSRTMRRL
jgi:hypothetical protein